MNRKLKNSLLILFILLLLFIVTAATTFRINPPLSITGITYDESNDRYRVLSIVNNGIGKITLKQIFINENESPVTAQLGISRSRHLVLGADIENDPMITFYDIDKIKIEPYLLTEKKAIVQPFHYGIIIRHDKPIKSVTVKYLYFGFPLAITSDTVR